MLHPTTRAPDPNVIKHDWTHYHNLIHNMIKHHLRKQTMLNPGIYLKIPDPHHPIVQPIAYAYGEGFSGRTYTGTQAVPDAYGNLHTTVASNREIEAKRAFPDERPLVDSASIQSSIVFPIRAQLDVGTISTQYL